MYRLLEYHGSDASIFPFTLVANFGFLSFKSRNLQDLTSLFLSFLLDPGQIYMGAHSDPRLFVVSRGTIQKMSRPPNKVAIFLEIENEQLYTSRLGILVFHANHGIARNRTFRFPSPYVLRFRAVQK